jgi:hypothetical protein
MAVADHMRRQRTAAAVAVAADMQPVAAADTGNL